MSRGIVSLLLWITTSLVVVSANAGPQINLGNIPAGKTVTVSYDVTVNNNTTGNEVSSQVTVTGDNFADVLSDDPDTVALNDATKTTVDAAETSLSLTASDTSPTTSENVTFTATVESTNNALPTPSGNVEFRIDGGSPTVVPLDGSGNATFDTPFAVGSYNVTADYVGNTESKAASNSVTITVSPGSTSTNITSVSSNNIQAGDSVTINFDITSSIVGLTPTGNVSVGDGSDSCSASVAVGSCSIQFSTAGTKSVVATYASNSSELNGSVSSPVIIDVVEVGAPYTRDDVINVNEDEAVYFDPLSNDQAAEGFDLNTLEIVQQPSSGTLEIDFSTGMMTYRGEKDFNGTDNAQYQLMDNEGEVSNASTIEFIVAPVNDAPVISSEPVKKAVESATYSYVIEASDAEGQMIQYTAPTLPAWLQLVGNQLNGTPQVADIGSHDVTIEVSDGIEVTSQSFKVNVVSFNSNDVAISQTVDSIAPLVGEDFVITYSLSNSGPVASTNVELSVELDGDATLATDDSRCNISANQVLCNISGLDANDSDDIELKVTGNSLGDIYSYAQITSADDEISENNQSGLGVSVTNETMADKAYTIGDAESQVALSGDLNNDGLNDIVLLNSQSDIGSVFINEGFYAFNKYSDIKGYETVVAAKLVDVNADGYLDLIVATGSGDYTLLYVGDGSGNFSMRQTLSIADTNAIDVGDINADDLPDLVIANNGKDEVYLNQNGLFQLSHELSSENSNSVKLADADGDGLLDALFALNNGDGNFYTNAELINSVAPGSSYSSLNLGMVSDIASLDINADGREEYVIAQSIKQTDPQTKPQNKLLQWDSGLSLVQSFGAVDSQQIITTDIDSDGDSDIFVRNRSGAHQLYFNDMGTFNVTDKLLINQDSEFVTWVFDENDVGDLLIAERLDEGSALYANQGNGNFGVAETDLALTYNANVSSVTEDGVIEAQLIVTNNGPSAAQGVELSASINSKLNVIRFGSGAESCTVSDKSMSCALGNVVPGDRVVIPLRLLAVSTGEATIRANVSSVIDDLNPSNNSQEVTVKVTPRRDSGGGQIGYLLVLMLALVTWRRRRHPR